LFSKILFLEQSIKQGKLNKEKDIGKIRGKSIFEGYTSKNNLILDQNTLEG